MMTDWDVPKVIEKEDRMFNPQLRESKLTSQE
jgi:hypothetical protein